VVCPLRLVCHSAEELSALPAAELAARLAEAYRLIGELAARNEQLAARVEQLERLAGKDSSTWSRPPSSDSPYKKKGRDRSGRCASAGSGGRVSSQVSRGRP